MAEITKKQARANLIKLRDTLAKVPDQDFDMAEWGDKCGTPACICGWANRLLFPDAPVPSRFETGEALGLDRRQTDYLFLPGTNATVDVYSLARPAHAVRVIDHLLKTGEVDWDRAFQ